VYVFVPVKDKFLCDECKSIHLLEDGVTPRVFKESEISHDYHKRGETSPSFHNLHPHCRCSLSVTLDGFGFDGNGRVTWIDSAHREYDYQHSGAVESGVEPRRKKLGLLEKSESSVGEPLEKALRLSMRKRDFINELGRFGWGLEDPNKHWGFKHTVSGQKWKGLSHSDPDTLEHHKIQYYAGQMGLKIRPGPKGAARLVAWKGHANEPHYRQVQGLTDQDFA
jgi:hypothetical protein